jgi:hypothetical protein
MNENEEQQMQSDDSQGMRDHSRSIESTASDGAPVLTKNDELLEMGASFDFDGFQVVRREFFAHLNEPSVSFNNYKFYVNTACLSKFPEAEHVQVLVNRKTKILALRPCEEGERDSFLWCINSKGKRKPKQTTCKLFFAKIISLMSWNPDYRYRLTGKLIHANGEYLIAFDLTATEVYQRTFPEGAKSVISKTPVFPSEWQDQFGLPFNQHRQSMQINIFDGYAIYAIKDNSKLENNASIIEQQDLMPSSNNGGLGE